MQASRLGISMLVLGCLAGRAAADDPAQPDRKFGGCNDSRSICAGPSASASFVILDLSDGTSKGGFVPGAGYGVTFFANQWYNTGLSVYVSYVTSGNSQPAVLTPTLVLSFAEYVRIGFGFERTSAMPASGGSPATPSKTDAIMVLGFGLDFGSTPGSQDKGILHALTAARD